MKSIPFFVVLGLAAGCTKPTPTPTVASPNAPTAAATKAASVTVATATPEPPAPSVVLQGPPVARVTPARGNLVAGKITPGDLTLGWEANGGTLINCVEHTRVDEIEGDKLGTTCHVARLAADAVGIWEEMMPSAAQLAPFVEGYSAADQQNAAKVVRETSDFNQFAVALRSPSRFFYVTETDLTSAVGGCGTSTTLFGNQSDPASLVPSCNLWKPEIRAAETADTVVVALRGIDGTRFGEAYEKLQDQGEKAPNPWDLLATKLVILAKKTGKTTTIPLLPVQAIGDTIALGRDKLLFVARGRGTKSSDPSLRNSQLAFSLVPFPPPPDGAGAWVTLPISGEIGRPIAAAIDGGFVIVWSEKPSKSANNRLRGVQLSPAGGVTDLGFLTPATRSSIAPSIAVQGDAIAISYTEETKGKPSMVRFACGGLQKNGVATIAAAAEIVGDPERRSRDSELALSPDGAGVIAWQEFTKTSQGVRTATFSCVK